MILVSQLSSSLLPYGTLSLISVKVILLKKLVVTRSTIGYHYFSTRHIASKWYIALREVNLRTSRQRETQSDTHKCFLIKHTLKPSLKHVHS